MAQSMKLAFAQDVTETSAVKRETLGATRILSDGRVFRYAKAGAAPLSAGKLGMAERAAPGHLGLAAPAVPIGTRVLSVTVGAAPVAENAYEDGLMQVADGPGKGRQYRVLSNSARAATGRIVLTLAEPVLAALTSASKLNLLSSPWRGVVETEVEENLPAGLAPVDVPAGAFYWAQTGGPAVFLASGAAPVGTMLVPGPVAGSLAAMNASLDTDQPVVGRVMAAAAADGAYASCLLLIG